MAREYGSKRNSRRGGGLPQQVLVMVVAYILGYFTASIFDIDTLSHWITTQVLENHEPKPSPVQNRLTKEVHATKPKFEFYTLLANEKGVAANQTATQALSAAQSHTAHSNPTTKTTSQPTNLAGVSSSATSSSKTLATTLNSRAPVEVAKPIPVKQSIQNQAQNGRYVVQVAAFKTRSDAEHMKGLLILKGFEVSVVTTSQAQGTWFRVVIGPYPNRVLAQKAQVILAKTERLNGMVRSAGG